MSDLTQLNRVNVQGRDYSFGATRAKCTCSSAADSAVKVITVGTNYTVEEGICLSVKFDEANEYGNVWQNYLYSTDDGNTLYTDPECTVLAELAPVGNRFIEYSGEGNKYNYYVFPVLSLGGFGNIPVCDCRGHYAGKGCWNAGDKVTFYFDGEAALIQNTDIRQKEAGYTVKADGTTEYTREEVDGVAQLLRGEINNAKVGWIYAGNQVLFQGAQSVSANTKTALMGAYNQSIILNGQIGPAPEGYALRCYLSMQATTNSGVHVRAILNSYVATSWLSTYSSATFRIIAKSSLFNPNDIPLEPTVAHTTGSGINLYLQTTDATGTAVVYNVTVHYVYVKV